MNDNTEKRDIFGALIPVDGNSFDLTAFDDDLIAGLDNALQGVAVGSGLPFLTLDKGGNGWYYGQERITVDPKAEVAVNLRTLQHGWVAWGEGAITGEEMVSIGAPMPPMPAQISAPWKAQMSAELHFISGADAGTTVLYKTPSDGGLKFYKALVNAIRQQLRVVKAQTDPSAPRPVIPIIRLASDFYMHPKFGKTYKPLLEILRWVDPRTPIDGVPPVTPAVAAAPKQAPLAGAAVDDVLPDVPPTAVPNTAGRRRRVGA